MHFALLSLFSWSWRRGETRGGNRVRGLRGVSCDWRRRCEWDVCRCCSRGRGSRERGGWGSRRGGGRARRGRGGGRGREEADAGRGRGRVEAGDGRVRGGGWGGRRVRRLRARSRRSQGRRREVRRWRRAGRARPQRRVRFALFYFSLYFSNGVQL